VLFIGLVFSIAPLPGIFSANAYGNARSVFKRRDSRPIRPKNGLFLLKNGLFVKINEGSASFEET